MASLRSLGVHRPSAFPYLVSESILSEDATEEEYIWETYNHDDDDELDDFGEEELVTTERFVVWSRGGAVRKVFNFEIEQEKVVQAILTWFPTDESFASKTQAHEGAEIRNGDAAGTFTTQGTQPIADPNHSNQSQPSRAFEGRSRALVVLLKSHAHVFFLSGATHVVNLPFEVDRAFPAPRGLLLQRKISHTEIVPPTPVLPTVPPNSFLSTSQSFSQSFSHNRRRYGSSLSSMRQSKSYKTGAVSALSLEDLLKNSAALDTDGLPRLFSFTNPLSELGLVISVASGPEPGSMLNVNGSSHRRLEAIDKAEEVMYVSGRNELNFGKAGEHQELLLAITANYQKNLYSIWSVAYIEPKSISSSRRNNPSIPTGKARRRSSYGPTAPGTGATTPAIRNNDRMRESVGVATRSKTVPPSLSASRTNEKLSDQTVEDALASQLDPDFDISRQPKESRRVSSLLSRAELSTSFDKSAFQDLATHRTSTGTSFGASFGAGSRRGQSFGGYNDRNNLGGPSQNRHRASTPGSVSRMSLGGVSIDDTLEDIMDDYSYDTLDDYDELDNLVFGGGSGRITGQEPMNGLRKELIMNRIAEVPIQEKATDYTVSQNGHQELSKNAIRVFTLTAPYNPSAIHERKLFIYLVDNASKTSKECELTVTRRRLSTTSSLSRSCGVAQYVCVPRLAKTQSIKGQVDAIKVFDGRFERVVSLTRQASGQSALSLIAGWGSHLPTTIPLVNFKLFNPFAILDDLPTSRRAAGRKRMITAREPLQRLLSSGVGGSLDILDGERQRHRVQVQLAPRRKLVSDAFEVFETVLPNHIADFLLEIWWCVCKSLPHTNDRLLCPEWTALVVVIFTMASPFIENVPRARKSGGRPTRKSMRTLSSTPQARTIADPELVPAWSMTWSREAARATGKSWTTQSWKWMQDSKPSVSTMSPPSSGSSSQRSGNAFTIASELKAKRDFIVYCTDLAREFNQSPLGKATHDQWRRLSASDNHDLRTAYLPQLLVALHLLREEHKLDIFSRERATTEVDNLAPVLAQLGRWLRWDAWSWRRGSYYDLDGGSPENWTYEESNMGTTAVNPPWERPPSIFEWLGTTTCSESCLPFPSLSMLIQKSTNSPHSLSELDYRTAKLTPRTTALVEFFKSLIGTRNSPSRAVELMAKSNISTRMLSTFPEAAKAPLMEAIIRCQANPPTTWSKSLLKLVHREDLDLSVASDSDRSRDVQHSHASSVMGLQSSPHTGAVRDVHTICQNSDKPEALQSFTEVERHYLTRLIFHEDRRYVEAYTLLEPLKQAVAEYIPDSRSEEAAVLEAQKNLMQWVMVRTFSLPAGSAMVKYNSKKPLLTEKWPLLGFCTQCLMKPMGNIVTADRSLYSDEKFSWAFFNAGVSAGLSISRDAQGIDTSWILYNKPFELTNRHAGLLLGLGLNGHLKTIAKWLSFKYLTPKHTMTSVGLLLGLSASFMGTMDTLITRLLSVHVTRMLPPGAAELNLSPHTQTTGLMGIGLLFYNTQHRRMSEIMLSEIEHVERPDPSEPPDNLRDEGYRLAAGFALGFINIGKGNDLRGLHDMRLVERLLGVAVGPKPVDVMHILDQATAGAVIAIALVFMKTMDQAVARKIDVPDTLPQFDYVRPDIFLLRTLAKHLIMWDDIRAEHRWMIKNLPPEYQDDYQMKNIRVVRSEQMPFYNIVAGLLWSISLKYAGTGDLQIRDFLIKYLDQFMRICRLPALRYDAKLTRHTVRNCQDLVALACATVMAGTGDLDIFRRLRSLHGRIGPDIPYGSHLAGHMAFGALFVAGGTHTFSTSNKAIACLICSFYPLFPMDVQDNKAHLQAFRHFWVLAAEPRCMIIRDVDTGRAITLPISVTLKSGATLPLTAPCLLPEIETIAAITTTSPEYWPATLDFERNKLHLESFHRNQTMRVRRRSAHDMYNSIFSSTLVALNDAQVSRSARLMWDWLFTLPSLVEFEKADVGLILPLDSYSSTFTDTSGTVVDERLVLRKQAGSWRRDDLWDLRVLFEWAERVQSDGGRLRWLGRSVVERLKAGILERGRAIDV